MKKKKVFTGLLSVIMVATLLAGCGSSSSSDSYYDGGSNSYAYESMAATADYATEEAYFDDAYDYEMSESKALDAGTEAPEVNDTSRKLIKNVSLSVETEEYDELIANVTSRINALGGYIEDSYSWNGSAYSGSRNKKSGSLTIRIPSDRLDDFLDNVAEISNITSKNYNVSDVTLQYVDVEARRDSLKTQHQRLLELMEQAETVEDIITIESRLSDIEYQLESAERQIRSYDNQVDYSTVYMDIQEVERYTPVEPKSRLQQMGEGFIESVYDAVDNFLDFIVGLVIVLPHLIVFAIVVLIIVLIIRAIVKGSKKRKQKKLAAKAQVGGYAPMNGAMQSASVRTANSGAPRSSVNTNTQQTSTGTVMPTAADSPQITPDSEQDAGK